MARSLASTRTLLYVLAAVVACASCDGGGTDGEGAAFDTATLDATPLLDTAGSDGSVIGDTTPPDVSEDVVVEDTLPQDVAVEDTLLQDVVVEDTLLQDVAVEDTLLQDVAVEDTLLEDTLLEDTLLEDILLQDTVGGDASADASFVDAEAAADADADTTGGTLLTATSAVVDPTGGTVAFDDVLLYLPPGAVREATEITLERHAAAAGDGFAPASYVYRLKPEGLRFHQLIEITFPAAGLPPEGAGVFWSRLGAPGYEWQPPVGVADGELVARGWHFSDVFAAQCHDDDQDGWYAEGCGGIADCDDEMPGYACPDGTAPPVADAGADAAVPAGDPVTLNGSGSYDPDGGELILAWELVQLPAESTTVLSPGEAPVLTTDMPGLYVAELIVTDDDGHEAWDVVYVEASGNLLPIAEAGADQVVPVGQTAILADDGSVDPEGEALSYSWWRLASPGGGAPVQLTPPGADPTASATIDAAGEWIFELRVHDVSGAVGTDQVQVTGQQVGSPPVAQAGPDQTVEVGEPVSLSAAGSHDPDGGPVTFQWELTSTPDGFGGTLASPFAETTGFTPTLAGDYVAQVTVTDATGLTDQTTVTVTATEAGTVEVTIDVGEVYGVGGLTADLTATVTGADPTYFQWKFGDGGTKNGLHASSVTHTWPEPGVWTVELTVTLPGAETVTATAEVSTGTGLMAYGMTATPSVSGVPLTVDLTAQVQNGVPPLTWTWTFGDGATGSGAPPTSHTYPEPGVYVVQADVMDDTGATAHVSALVDLREDLPAQFAVDLAISEPYGDDGLSVDFAAAPTTEAGWYSWTFGDGGTTVGADHSAPTHNYAAPGTYPVTVWVWETGTNTAASASGEVTVGATADELVVTMEADPTLGAAPLGVTFDATTSGGTPPVTWSWDYGDGSPLDTSPPPRSHTYPDPGTYEAKVVVTDAEGVQAEDTVTVTTTALPPFGVTLAAAPPYGPDGRTVDFNAMLSDLDAADVDEVAWDFGDGTTAKNGLLAMTHTYPTGGTWTASVEVTAADGRTAQGIVQVTVDSSQPLSVTAAAAPKLGDAPLEVTLEAAVSGGDGDVSLAWDFKDGETLQTDALTVTHTYTQPGRYQPTVVATSGSQTANAQTSEIRVRGDIVTDVTISSTTVMVGKPVSVEATATGGAAPYTYAWNFGDGSPQVHGQSMNHTYDAAGKYTIYLVIKDDVADSLVVQRQIEVVPAGTKDVFADITPTSGTAPLPVTMTATPIGIFPQAYTWTFFDGGTQQTLTGHDVTHTFVSPGVHAVTLTASTTSGNYTDMVVVTVDAGLEVDLTAAADDGGDALQGVVPRSVAYTASITAGTPPYDVTWSAGGQTLHAEQTSNATATWTHLHETIGLANVSVAVSDSSDPPLTETRGTTYDSRPTVAPAVEPSGGTVPFEAVLNANLQGGHAAEPYTFEWHLLMNGHWVSGLGYAHLNETVTGTEAALPYTFDYAPPGGGEAEITLTASGPGLQVTKTLTVALEPPATCVDGDVDGVPETPGCVPEEWRDCAPDDPALSTTMTLYVDGDGDGRAAVGAEPVEVCTNEVPEGYALSAGDIDDTDPECVIEATFYYDADGDGFGVTEDVWETCVLTGTGHRSIVPGLTGLTPAVPKGWSQVPGDCDDTNAAVYVPVEGHVDADWDGYGTTQTTACVGNNTYKGLPPVKVPGVWHYDPANADTDGDGLLDGEDPSPTLRDADGGGLEDLIEVLVDGTDPLDPTDDLVDPEDSDRDGLTDVEEAALGTDPLDPDTDDDGLLDGVEAASALDLDPLEADTDGDLLCDGPMAVPGVCRRGEDSNRNGVVDPGETHPTVADTDGGGVPDGTERDWDLTDPLAAGNDLTIFVDDPDRDGLPDKLELGMNTDPMNPDTDGDGLCDGPWAVGHVCRAGEDLNENGVVDPWETDPTLVDTDGGGDWDSVEVLAVYGFPPEVVLLSDPWDPSDDQPGGDWDQDGMTGYREAYWGTDPLDPDTDGDGLLDGVEVVHKIDAPWDMAPWFASWQGWDCDDENAEIGPGRPDIPGDGIDQDCDGVDAPFSDDAGVFVAQSGDDAAPGTMAAPVATLARAAELSDQAGGVPVFVAHGTYATWVLPTASMYGGYRVTDGQWLLDIDHDGSPTTLHFHLGYLFPGFHMFEKETALRGFVVNWRTRFDDCVVRDNRFLSPVGGSGVFRDNEVLLETDGTSGFEETAVGWSGVARRNTVELGFASETPANRWNGLVGSGRILDNTVRIAPGTKNSLGIGQIGGGYANRTPSIWVEIRGNVVEGAQFGIDVNDTWNMDFGMDDGDPHHSALIATNRVEASLVGVRVEKIAGANVVVASNLVTSEQVAIDVPVGAVVANNRFLAGTVTWHLGYDAWGATTDKWLSHPGHEWPLVLVNNVIDGQLDPPGLTGARVQLLHNAFTHPDGIITRKDGTLATVNDCDAWDCETSEGNFVVDGGFRQDDPADLAAGSALIDAGSDLPASVAVHFGRGALMSDIDGEPRPLAAGGAFDVGPDELVETIPEVSIVAESPLIGPAPHGVSLRAEVTGGNGVVAIAWDLTGDGVPDATGPTAHYVYEVIGATPVTVTVTDGDGDTDSKTVFVEATGSWLQAVIEASATTAHRGTPITFSADSSVYPSSFAPTFTWAVVDAPFEAAPTLTATGGETTTLEADRSGAYIIELTLSVNDSTDTAQAVVHLTNEAPTMEVTGPSRATVGQPLVLTLTAEDPKGEPLTYAWTAQDAPEGSVATPAPLFGTIGGEPITTVITPDVPGEYVVGARVTDGDETVLVGHAFEALANDKAPQVIIQAPELVYAGLPTPLVADIAGGSPGYTVTWDLDFEDAHGADGYADDLAGGTAALSGAEIAPTFLVAGQKWRVYVRVEDAEGRVGSKQRILHVVPEQPTIIVEPLGTWVEGTPKLIAWHVWGGTPPYEHTWDFGDGSLPGVLAYPRHAYDAEGTYTVSLQVTDATGASATASGEVTVVAGATGDGGPSGTPQPLLDADLSASPSSGPAPLEVSVSADPAGEMMFAGWGLGTAGGAIGVAERVGDVAIGARLMNQAGVSLVDWTSVRVEAPEVALDAAAAAPQANPALIRVGNSTAYEHAPFPAALDVTTLWRTPGPEAIGGEPFTEAFASPTVPGDYLAELRAVDRLGRVDRTTFSFQVIPETDVEPHVVVSSVGPRQGPAPLTVTLDAGLALADGGVTTEGLVFEWEVSDVVVETTSATLAWTFDEPGMHPVLVRAYDGEGGPLLGRAIYMVDALRDPAVPVLRGARGLGGSAGSGDLIGGTDRKLFLSNGRLLATDGESGWIGDVPRWNRQTEMLTAELRSVAGRVAAWAPGPGQVVRPSGTTAVQVTGDTWEDVDCLLGQVGGDMGKMVADGHRLLVDGKDAAYIFEWQGGWELAWTEPIDPGEHVAGLALEGDVAIIGVRGPLGTAGSVRVLERNDAGWGNLLSVLAPQDSQPNDQFGEQVFLDGGTILVGASHADLETAGGTVVDAGAVSVFRRDAAGSWSLTNTITAPAPLAHDRFGVLGVSGPWAILGDARQLLLYERQVDGTIETLALEAELLPDPLRLGDRASFDHGDTVLLTDTWAWVEGDSFHLGPRAFVQPDHNVSPPSDRPALTARVGAPLTITAADSGATAWPLAYSWAVESEPLGGTATLSDSTGPTVHVTVDAPGTYAVVVQVVDANGATSQQEVTLYAASDDTPWVEIASPPVPWAAPSHVELVADGAGRPPLQFWWSFGDGGTAKGREVSHLFATPGDHEVTLRMIDGRGAAVTATHTVTVPEAAHCTDGSGHPLEHDVDCGGVCLTSCGSVDAQQALPAPPTFQSYLAPVFDDAGRIYVATEGEIASPAQPGRISVVDGDAVDTWTPTFPAAAVASHAWWGGQTIEQIAAVPGGGVVVAGWLVETGHTHDAPKTRHPFLARYTPDGTVVWARLFRPDQTAYREDMYVAAHRWSGLAPAVGGGAFALLIDGGGLDFGDLEPVEHPNDHHVLARVGSDGEVVWTHRVYMPYYTEDDTPLVALGGDVLVAAAWRHTLTGEPSPYGGPDVMLGRFDGTTGALLWSRVVGGNAMHRVEALAAGPDGSFALVGRNQGSAVIYGDGPTDALTRGTDDNQHFIAVYDGAGAPLWARALAGTYADMGGVVGATLGADNSVSLVQSMFLNVEVSTYGACAGPLSQTQNLRTTRVQRHTASGATTLHEVPRFDASGVFSDGGVLTLVGDEVTDGEHWIGFGDGLISASRAASHGWLLRLQP